MSQELLQDNLRMFVVPVDIMDVPDLDIYEQMVYIVLRSFANPRVATAFPSYATIAKLGRMSRRKAIDAVSKLVEKGLIKKELRLDVSKNRKVRNTSNLYTIQAPAKKEVVHDMHHPSAQCAPPPVHDMHHPSAQCAPEHNHLTKSFRTKSKENSQSVKLPTSIQQTIIENGLTDKTCSITKVYESVSNQKGFNTALFIQTLQKEALIKEAKKKTGIALERYLRKAILNNIQESSVPVKIFKQHILRDKLPASIQNQLKRESENIEVTPNSEVSSEDDQELQMLLESLRAIKKKNTHV